MKILIFFCCFYFFLSSEFISPMEESFFFFQKLHILRYFQWNLYLILFRTFYFWFHASNWSSIWGCCTNDKSAVKRFILNGKHIKRVLQVLLCLEVKMSQFDLSIGKSLKPCTKAKNITLEAQYEMYVK